ncbi:MAG: type II secretion system protein, partial [Candidatus Pacebacteria bacterium]|nr:type II secretion system protein [Candidatus Paceibacterota bacterium]
MKNKNFKKAYTLIEMLMVVAIIGILASSILVGLGSA